MHRYFDEYLWKVLYHWIIYALCGLKMVPGSNFDKCQNKFKKQAETKHVYAETAFHLPIMTRGYFLKAGRVIFISFI